MQGTKAYLLSVHIQYQDGSESFKRFHRDLAEAIEQASEQAAEKYPGAEFLVMPPLERPLMPARLCHRKRG